MAPDGYAIRMMEPGEVAALHGIARSDDEPESFSPSSPASRIADLGAFTRFLLANEVFVLVDKAAGETAGFAVASPQDDLYWMSCLHLAPAYRHERLAAALLKSVSERAGWFFYRAIGLSVDGAAARAAGFFGARGFVTIPPTDCPRWLDEKRRASAPDPGKADMQRIMLKWL
ncbi:GNAT family N-acetyltransferase [Fulvimarina endophytica]|nr:GNAT family N-acetyltransferase [Fulvimarina endophytica]